MSTVVDDLLQDFEDSRGSDEEDEDVAENGVSNGLDHDDAMKIDDASDHDGDEDEEMRDIGHDDDPNTARSKLEKMDLTKVKDVRSVAGLMYTLQPVLQKIEECQARPPEAHIIGNIDDHPEYHLLTQSNSLSTQIDSEIVIVHKFIRDHYSVRFPELERLIANPLEYAKVVAIIGNGPMDSDSIKLLQTSTDNPIGVTLRSTLDGPSLMIVTVEATTTRGREMSPDELHRVISACEMVVALDKAKQTLTEFVQSRMNVFAPNMTTLIGSLTAAQLLNTAGGLTALSKTPACNIASWGSKKEKNPGLATNLGIKQQGYLYHSPLIKGIPPDLKKQAMRIVSAKLVLAARIDRMSNNAAGGAAGEELKAACLERLDKLTAPPPNRGQRALPAPADQPSRKRGGRRARKAKEATAMTDMRKSQNRLAFGKEEQEVGYGNGDATVGLGMIGQANDGRIRALQVDQRTRAKVGGKSKGWAGGGASNGLVSAIGGAGSGMDVGGGRGLRAAGVGSTIGTRTGMGSAVGTASSLAFTPMQGLELVDPKVQAELSRKRQAEDDRWFNSGAFTQISQSGAHNDGFKVPDVPPNKKLRTGAETMGPPPPRPRPA